MNFPNLWVVVFLQPQPLPGPQITWWRLDDCVSKALCNNVFLGGERFPQHNYSTHVFTGLVLCLVFVVGRGSLRGGLVSGFMKKT